MLEPVYCIPPRSGGLNTKATGRRTRESIFQDVPGNFSKPFVSKSQVGTTLARLPGDRRPARTRPGRSGTGCPAAAARPLGHAQLRAAHCAAERVGSLGDSDPAGGM